MPMHPWLRSQARTSVVSPSWNCSPKQYLDVLRDRQTPGTLTWNMGTRIEARRMPACLLRGAHDRACRHLGENGRLCVRVVRVKRIYFMSTAGRGEMRFGLLCR